MTDDELDNLAALERAATPAPWDQDGEKSDGEWGVGDDTHVGFMAREIVAESAGRTVVLFDSVNSTAAEIKEYRDEDSYQAYDGVALANAELIVTMRNALPALLAELKQLREAAAAQSPPVGWTGKRCPTCKGLGDVMDKDRDEELPCPACGGTGDEFRTSINVPTEGGEK